MEESVVKKLNAWKVGMCAGGLLAMLGVLLAGLSVWAKILAGRYLIVFYAYDDGALLMMLAVLGIICSMAGAYCAVVCHVSENNWKKLKRLQYMVYVYVAWGAALAVLCFLTYYLIITCSRSLGQLFLTGFIEKIVLYVSDETVRITIDRMQSELHCCGSTNISDWFDVIWSDNVSVIDNAVPESCCDREALQSRGLSDCVLAVPYGEASKLSVFPDACVLSAVTYFGSILKTRSMLIIGCGIIQAFITAIIVWLLLTQETVNKTSEIKTEEEEEEKKKLIEE